MLLSRLNLKDRFLLLDAEICIIASHVLFGRLSIGIHVHGYRMWVHLAAKNSNGMVKKIVPCTWLVDTSFWLRQFLVRDRILLQRTVSKIGHILEIFKV